MMFSRGSVNYGLIGQGQVPLLFLTFYFNRKFDLRPGRRISGLIYNSPAFLLGDFRMMLIILSPSYSKDEAYTKNA